eukprot:CAMPEP_0197627136 /NCGR_PEP_ID=MMETSP1338-20131121/5829_1 /TAXON_ID=43686 ORGANISM="Pelagodinium beii, Strain RCC1491" /NCGR_SAMPLE_ID=MMETSP1338 /ASSEMBLY_ACC=CAM_ASM_000754 /LENGTH=146 /DNA_ID=CAMNT_0043197769 /DNA_START=28 /DNA_END=465 /DNA_ORIENTATION=+
MGKATLKRNELSTASGKDIYESIIKKMKTGEHEIKTSTATTQLKPSKPKTVPLKSSKPSKSAGFGKPVRCSAKRCPLRWTGMSQHVGPIRDLREYLINEHNFQPRRTLPKNKRFCTSSTLSPESEGKLWGHVVTLEGGRQLACVVG